MTSNDNIIYQVQAEIDVINASWNPGGSSNGLADTIGLMVYEGDQSLLYIKNYATGTKIKIFYTLIDEQLYHILELCHSPLILLKL